MLHNYLKIALRQIRRNGRYMFINVLGLSIALAFCILSFTNYRFAHSFDQWHPNHDHIFRIEFYKTGNQILHGTCPATLAEVAPADIPGVETTTRIDSRGLTIKQGENVFNEQVHFVDTNFLELFDFPLLSGQVRLNDRKALLISETMAKKFFGDENPIGRQLTLYADEPAPMILTVSGVAKDCPKNSSIHFDFLTHLNNQLQADGPVVYDSWKWFVDAAFVRLHDPSDASKVEAALQAYRAPQNQANLDWPVQIFRLEPLAEIALNSRDIRWNNLWGGTPPAAIWDNIVNTMLVFSVLILLLTISGLYAIVSLNAIKMFRALAVRRVLGARIGHISYQLNRNFLIVMLFALVLGGILGRVFSLALMNSIYKIHAGTPAFVLIFSAFCMSLVLIFTVGIKVWQIWRMNLAEALKAE